MGAGIQQWTESMNSLLLCLPVQAECSGEQCSAKPPLPLGNNGT